MEQRQVWGGTSPAALPTGPFHSRTGRYVGIEGIMANGDSAARAVDKPRAHGDSIINDPRARALFFQALVIAGVVVCGYFLIQNTLANLERQGIASGFGFMGSTAGFAIGMSLIDYSEEMSYGRAFIVSLLNTILLAGVGVFFATIIGFVVGIARLSPNWLIAKIATVYIETLRNIPLLLQIFFWYFGVLRLLPQPNESIEMGGAFLNIRGLFTPKPIPEDGFGFVVAAFVIAVIGAIVVARWARKRQEATGEQFPAFLTGLGLIVALPVLAAFVTGLPLHWEYPEATRFNVRGGLEVIPEFVAMVLALALYTASFIAEIVRAGIQSVNWGQTEASRALGLKEKHALRLVIVPQALRVIIPPLTSQYLNLTKNSSLSAAIAFPDLVLVFAGTVLMQTGQAVEIVLMTMAVYLTLSLLISMFMNWYNAKMALVER
jgi:general L-amino acid transport system permease protein